MVNKEEREKMHISPDYEKIRKIIKNGDVKILNEYADYLGDGLRNKLKVEKERDRRTGKIKYKEEPALTTSQIRNILDSIQRMTKFDPNQLQLLRPKLAYVAGRHRGRVREFQEIIDKAILMVENEKEFDNFKNFVEAIVAYHRYHGGE